MLSTLKTIIVKKEDALKKTHYYIPLPQRSTMPVNEYIGNPTPPE